METASFTGPKQMGISVELLVIIPNKFSIQKLKQVSLVGKLATIKGIHFYLNL